MAETSLEQYLTEQTPEEEADTTSPPTVSTIRSFWNAVQRARNKGSNFPAAACKGIKTSPSKTEDWIDFYPENPNEANPARLICEQCVHRVDCLLYAMEAREKEGIWGGATAEEREGLRRNYANYKRRFKPTAKQDEPLLLPAYVRKYSHKYIETPDPLGPFTSRLPNLTRVEVDALCLTGETAQVFEDLDSKRIESTADDYAEAIAICHGCANYRRGCDGAFFDADLKPTVAGGDIIGNVAVSLKPSKRQIAEFESINSAPIAV